MIDRTLQHELSKPFPVSRIHWRVGACTADKSKGIALAYIDARDVMQRLDEAVGISRWQDRHPFSGCCDIGIWIDPEWVWKSNGAGETKVEGEKGQFSDAFKRAGVMWGIGRYLYSLPNKWVALENKRIVSPPELPQWATPEGYDKIMKEREK